jgi:transaldolase
LNTKIFCDIAELDQIKKFNKKNIVKGFTTNPSLMRKAGAVDYKSYSKKILINQFHLKSLLMNMKKSKYKQ